MKNLKFLVTEVCKIAFNDEKVILENDSAKIIIHFKDQDDHGHIKNGDEVDFEDVMYGPAEESEEESESEDEDEFQDENDLAKKEPPVQLSPEEVEDIQVQPTTVFAKAPSKRSARKKSK